jgi:hypothetical protein
VASREYLTRQATTLLKFAKTTTDTKVAAGFIEKAADLQDQVHGTASPQDRSPRAPDVEIPA